MPKEFSSILSSIFNSQLTNPLIRYVINKINGGKHIDQEVTHINKNSLNPFVYRLEIPNILSGMIWEKGHKQGLNIYDVLKIFNVIW